MNQALALLKAAATTGIVAHRDPVEIFLNKLDMQIAYAKQVKEGKEINTRSLWFKKEGAEYIVRVGRNAFEIAGAKLFKAKDLDTVVELLGAAKQAIKEDKALQQVIARHSADRSERLKAGRAEGKKKEAKK
ncbi:hypothetical protein [Brucella anthropi]|uniref:hypothetical protein n=1 Tax=Brucella anthropi TaxID=529 RepID=UPI0021659A75|nr:hypothetical protein [Brucella anthropi]UVV67087.1 hypothetical protein NW321_11510 [Brucella anthropi]